MKKKYCLVNPKTTYQSTLIPTLFCLLFYPQKHHQNFACRLKLRKLTSLQNEKDNETSCSESCVRIIDRREFICNADFLHYLENYQRYFISVQTTNISRRTRDT